MLTPVYGITLPWTSSVEIKRLPQKESIMDSNKPIPHPKSKAGSTQKKTHNPENSAYFMNRPTDL